MGQVTTTEGATSISKYFKRFQALAEAGNFMSLRGDMLIVERLPKIELKTAGGIILPHDVKTYRDTMSDRITDFGIVLMTGPGHVYDDGTKVPCDSQPGDIILLPGNTSWYSAFGTIADYEAFSIGLVRDAQVMLQFKDYEKAMEVLNAATKNQV